MPFGTSSSQFTNKELDMLGQSLNDSSNDFFQYVDFDSVGAEDASFTVDSDTPHMVSATSDSNSADTSTSEIDEDARKIDLLLQPWLGESTDNQNTASFCDQLPSATSIYSEQSGRAAISDSELLSLESITLSSPKLPSLPSSPTQSATKIARRRDRILSSVSKTFKRNRGSQGTLCPPVQKSDESPKMMSSSRFSQEWEQPVMTGEQKFDFGFPQNGLPLSPPPSARVSDASSNGAAMMFKVESQTNGIYNPHQFANGVNGVNNYTPLTTPIAADGFVDMSNLQASVDSQYPSTPLQSTWDQNANIRGYGDYRTSPFGGDVVENETNPVWWNHATSTEVAHPSPNVYHSDARFANKTLAMQLQNDVAYNGGNLGGSSSAIPNGLMIQIPEGSGHQPYVLDASTHDDFYTNPQQHRTTHRSSRHRRHQNNSSSPPNTPSPKSHSHSRSWSHPTTLRSSSSKGNRDPSYNPHHKRNPRTPSRKSSSNNMASQRSQSMQSPVVDFVNFTPSDSMKILTGVAPSGSSKTKARREKEANEKRRKLSLAALRAVRAAGGDVESLVEEGLFV